MTVFKTFLKILNKCKAPIIMYTVFLVFFGGFNMQNADSSTNFSATKPDVVIINKDADSPLSNHMVSYLGENFTIKDIADDDLDDALFYRDANYIIYIPDNFGNSMLKGENMEIGVKSTGDYQASLAEMILSKYLETASIYAKAVDDERELIENIDETLSKATEVELLTKLDTTALEKATFFYNFLNYCLLAGTIYVISLVLSIFKNEKVNKRMVISSTDYRTINRKLLWANGSFALALWIIYVVLSIFLVGDAILSTHGLLYMANSLIFTICALTIAFLLGTIVTNKETINGIVNVIALGSSFLCGAFVPVQWLPDAVIEIAHVLPSYWFIDANERIKALEIFSWETLKPFIVDLSAVIAFSLFFILLTNMISRKKRKIA